MKKNIFKNSKKIIALMLAAGLMTGLTGCGADNAGADSSEKKEEVSSENDQDNANKTEDKTEDITVNADVNTGTEEAKDVASDESVSAHNEDKEDSGEKKEVIVLAAASLTDVCDRIKGIYEESHPDVELTFSYAGSGALQTQIEEGAPADLFISAAKKQMNALKDEGLMLDETITDLLENRIVLIVPAGSENGPSDFEAVTDENVKMIGIGEVESVPAGTYAKTVFTNIGIWDEVEKKANFGTDVRTVLGWVEESAVDCGVVYATDAYTTDKVKIAAQAPDGSCDPVIYPAGVVKSAQSLDEAKEFLEYLKSDEAMKIFEEYGFNKA